MIKIISFSTAKNNSSNTTISSTVTGYANSPTIINNGNSFEPHNLWGQYFDDTQDITGDLTGVGKLTASGDVITSGALIGSALTTSGDAIVNGNLSVAGNSNVSGTSTSNYLNVNNDINAKNISASNEINGLKGLIDSLTSTTINVDSLTVNKSLKAFELIIDKIKSVEGEILVSPSNATLSLVESGSDGNYICYYTANDNNGRAKVQSFEEDDQIVCESFNLASGETLSASNKFYWAKVVSASTQTVVKEINGQNVSCWYFVLSSTDKDSKSNSIPEAGDEVALLGNRSNAERANAISIGAYNNPYLDSELKAPFIVQYENINSYDLTSKRKNVFAANLNSFQGTFTTINGDNIETLINNAQSGNLTYLHTAYSTSSDGSANFNKTYFDDAVYIGLCSNHTESDSNLTYTNYTWIRIKGDKGSSSTEYRLIPIREFCGVDKNRICGYYLNYNLCEVDDSGAHILPKATSGISITVDFYSEDNTKIKTETDDYSTSAIQFSNDAYQNWNNITSSSERLSYIKVDLVYNNTIIDSRTIFNILLPSASFEITDEIESSVIGNAKNIDSVTNSVSQIKQDYSSITESVSALTNSVSSNTENINSLQVSINGIETNVENNTKNISSLTNSVSQINQNYSSVTETVSSLTNSVSSNTSSISQLQVSVSGISSTVKTLSGNQETYYSYLNQRADEIELGVKNTGIDIEDGTITLNSENTNIEGNLNIQSSGNGLTLLDANGYPRTQFVADSISDFSPSGNGLSMTVTTHQYQYSANTAVKMDLGKIESGSIIKVTGAAIDLDFWDSVSSVTYSYTIYQGTTALKTFTGTATKGSTDFVYNITTANSVTATTSGSFYLSATFTVNGTKSSGSNTGLISANFYLSITVPKSIKIGYDGEYHSFDSKNYDYFGSDKAELIRNGQGIEVSSSGIQGIDSNGKFDLPSQFKEFAITSSGTYTIDRTYSLIVVQPTVSSDVVIKLPIQCEGKMFIVKNLGTGNCTLQCSNSAYGFYDRTVYSKSTTYSAKNVALMMVYTYAGYSII